MPRQTNGTKLAVHRDQAPRVGLALALVADKNLTDSAVRIMLALVHLAGDETRTRASNGDIGAVVHMSDSKVRRGLDLLVELGYCSVATFKPTAQDCTGREITLGWLIDPALVPALPGRTAEGSPSQPWPDLDVSQADRLEDALINLAAHPRDRFPYHYLDENDPDEVAHYRATALSDESLAADVRDRLAHLLRSSERDFRSTAEAIRRRELPIDTVFWAIGHTFEQFMKRLGEPVYQPGCHMRAIVARMQKERERADYPYRSPQDLTRSRRFFNECAQSYLRAQKHRFWRQTHDQAAPSP